jgi:hypothetical protein
MERNEGVARDRTRDRPSGSPNAMYRVWEPYPDGPSFPCRSGERRSGARGIALVWTALLLFAVVGILGLSLDWGKAGWNVHELHNAADAGALAGAQVVKMDETRARQMAILTAFKNDTEGRPVTVADNPANAIDGEVVLGRWIRQERRFVETDVSPSAVKVVGNRLGARDDAPSLQLHFGPAFHVDTVGVSRYAIAWSRGSTGAGILVLADDPTGFPGWTHRSSFPIDGGPIIDLRYTDPVTGESMVGDIQNNGTSEESPWAATRVMGSSPQIWAADLDTVGDTNPSADDAGAWASMYGDPSCPFSVNPQSPRIDDPLAGVEPPDIRTMPVGSDTTGKTYGYDPLTGKFPTITGGTLTLNPGYYPGGIDMSGGSLTLNPGVYAFGGAKVKNNPPGLVITGGGLLTANGVMLYITGDPTGAKTGVQTQYGRIDLGGSGSIQIASRGDILSPPEVDGEMGIAIWQDRSNPNYGRIIGTTGLKITGTIYCGYNAMEIGGTADQMGNQLIAGALWLHGTVNLRIPYDGRNFVESYRSILVE